MDFSLRALSDLLWAGVRRAEAAESQGVGHGYEQSPTIGPLQDLFKNSRNSSVTSGEMLKAAAP